MSKSKKQSALYVKNKLLDLLWFAREQALSCIFAVGIFATLVVSKSFSFGLARYDFVLIVCILLQVFMVLSKYESTDELKVICVFHIVGLCLEIFKVNVGSWSYPAEGITKIFGVPLYSGFMYAAVASYMCQAWRRMSLKVVNVPMRSTMFVAVLIYINFYTNYWLPDMRWLLVLAALYCLRNVWVYFTVRTTQYKMHLSLSFVLIGFFIWIAENIGTYIGAWQYPDQKDGWTYVHPSKVGSWAILIIFSFMLVLWLKSKKTMLITKD